MRKLSTLLMALILLLLAGCAVPTPTDPTEPTEMADVVWNQIQIAVEQFNAKQSQHLTVHLTNETLDQINPMEVPAANEIWICDEIRYVEQNLQGEWKPYYLVREGTTYWPDGKNQWTVMGESDEPAHYTIDLPKSKDALISWSETEGLLHAVVQTENALVTFCLDNTGRLLWQSESAQGSTVDDQGQMVPSDIHFIVVFHDTDPQQIHQEVDAVVSKMEITGNYYDRFE